MSNDQSWDAKKDEVWRRIVETEEAVKKLASHIANVENLAKNKVSANEEEAIKAAEQAKQSAAKIAEIGQKADEFSVRLPNLQNQVTEAGVNSEEAKRHAEESKEAATAIVGYKAEAEKATAEITVAQEKAKKGVEEAEAKWATTNQQVQNIANLNAQASSDAATAKASREAVEKLQQEITGLKNKFAKMQTDWEKRLEGLQKQHENQLQSLYQKHDQELSDLSKRESDELSKLNEKYLAEFESRTKEIESLLPGATSAGLASAFADRKNDIQKNKNWWIVLLIASASLLVCFGVFSLTPWGNKIGAASSFSGRIVIVAGLILLEEFARRNFNIISRLAESYAYKEALAKSYFGYKKQMEEIPMPSGNETEKTMGHSVLMETFLGKLDDEPGKHVFDKEKQIIGPGAIIDKISPNNKNSATGEALQELSKGNLLTKISWPIVAVVAILSIAVCVLAYLLGGRLL